MYNQFSFMLALLLVIIAGVTVLIMLEMGGGPSQESGKKSGWAALNHFLGYLFLMLFAALLAWMIFRAGSFQEDMPAPAIILALLLVPLIMIKVVVARQKALVSTRLILLGMAIFTLSFGLTGMAAYYYSKRDSNKTVSDGGMSMEPGQTIMSRKCSKCHTLERIYTSTVTDWTPTVNKMAAFDSSNISEAEAEAIVSYLNQKNEKQPVTETERGRKLIAAKCSICHSLDRVFIADMDEQHWRQTVEDMMKIEGTASYLSEEEKKLAVSFLSSRHLLRKDLGTKTGAEPQPPVQEGVRSLVARKCSAGCHALDRVLRTEKTREAWLETVNSMIEITGHPEYLSAEEKEQIIKFLTLPAEQRGKTQDNGASAPPKSASPEPPLISSKCACCHTLDRVHQAKKNRADWEKTVSSMMEFSGNPHYLTEQEKREIISIISGWESVE
jgi:cytochrome c5